MIGYITLGTNDLERAKAFYDSLLSEMGVKRLMEFGGRGYGWAASLDQPMLCIFKPYDGNRATVGNGVMAGISVDSRETVDRMHRKALELGGTDEGKPGLREVGGEGFYAAYFRDLDGNKLDVFCYSWAQAAARQVVQVNVAPVASLGLRRRWIAALAKMHAAGQVCVRLATIDDLGNVREAYRAWGYRGSIGPNDMVLIATRDGDLLGIARLAEEGGVCVLRGMQVAPSSQRQGIGTTLLHEVVKRLGGAECYCVPYTHLDGFYAQASFRRCSSTSAPEFLADRLSRYREGGSKVILMRRTEVTEEHDNAR